MAQLEGKLTPKNGVLSELMEEHVKLKRSWGDLKALWVPHDIRDAIVDFIGYWSKHTEIYASRFIRWIGISPSKFYNWKECYGKVTEHNHLIQRDFWLEEGKKEAIVQFFWSHPNEGYRRLAFMMLDQDVVAVSPTSVYRVLSKAGLLKKWNSKSSTKGTGFHGPSRPHEHWHIDVSYLNISISEALSIT